MTEVHLDLSRLSAKAYLCPICGEEFKPPAYPVVPPGLGDVMGTGDAGLASIHHHQNMRRFEQDMERHLKTHTVVEWATKFREVDNLTRSLTKELYEMTQYNAAMQGKLDRAEMRMVEIALGEDARSSRDFGRGVAYANAEIRKAIDGKPTDL